MNKDQIIFYAIGLLAGIVIGIGATFLFVAQQNISQSRAATSTVYKCNNTGPNSGECYAPAILPTLSPDEHGM